ncbi:Transcriptional regulator, XRE family OS=Tsukamurella paurometabola (strain ATCC 8368 / DSM/ CCUG 35730 / CIP 100753 / JCM 10117 / KCTC 9821 / NBRC 16120/ NCIMB 702349 / NCTC 13040) OX=521096 GN=Tpau_0894 PE=4 SV=1 [Tsukamurella paurometabola]|nr:Uncharacterised protein [Tsukamurella paurometabola]
MTQLDLAVAVGVSTRHLSFVETGRSRPSRRLILEIGEGLDIPLVARNELLLAAGFAPRFTAHRLDDEPMRPVRAALDTVLAAHDPNPALVLGDGFDLVAANAGAAVLVDGVDDALLTPPINVMRLCLHPGGLAPRLINRVEVAESILARVRRSYDRTADPRLGALYDELREYAPEQPDAESGSAPEIFVPFRLTLRGGGQVRLVSTLTTFGSPRDAVLESLVLEAFYPGDEATRTALAAAAEDSADRAVRLVRRLPHLARYLT